MKGQGFFRNMLMCLVGIFGSKKKQPKEYEINLPRRNKRVADGNLMFRKGSGTGTGGRRGIKGGAFGRCKYLKWKEQQRRKSEKQGVGSK